MNTKKAVFTIPVASTDFTREAFLDCSGFELVIRYSYESDRGLCSSGIKFTKVAAFRSRGELCCTVWHIEDAYDTLVEIEGSAWAAELKADVPEPFQHEWRPRHYMIYLDSVGCFEFLAESWEALPESPQDWDTQAGTCMDASGQPL